MAHIRIFLSTVSSEFRSYRDRLAEKLKRPNLSVHVQEDFIAAGTAFSTHGVNTIPFYIYYSMFGYQRVGDLIWAAADSRCRGFLMGATAGRTTLN